MCVIYNIAANWNNVTKDQESIFRNALEINPYIITITKSENWVYNDPIMVDIAYNGIDLYTMILHKDKDIKFIYNYYKMISYWEYLDIGQFVLIESLALEHYMIEVNKPENWVYGDPIKAVAYGNNQMDTFEITFHKNNTRTYNHDIMFE